MRLRCTHEKRNKITTLYCSPGISHHTPCEWASVSLTTLRSQDFRSVLIPLRLEVFLLLAFRYYYMGPQCPGGTCNEGERNCIHGPLAATLVSASILRLLPSTHPAVTTPLASVSPTPPIPQESPFAHFQPNTFLT